MMIQNDSLTNQSDILQQIKAHIKRVKMEEYRQNLCKIAKKYIK